MGNGSQARIVGFAGPVSLVSIKPVPAVCTVVGTHGDDVLYGTSGDDHICGYGGNDTIYGYGGNDTLDGGPGNDKLFGGKGKDTLYGRGGADVLNGGPGSDRLYGGSGGDILAGRGGNDTLFGHAGNDTLNGHSGNDTLHGHKGDDTLYGGKGNDVLGGGKDRDRLYGRGGADVLKGGLGADKLYGGKGKDLLVVLEYQRDGLAASGPDGYLELLLKPEFLRGELQTLGRDEAVAQVGYQLHPLWNVSGLAMWNMTDGSVLVAPGVGYTAGDETTIAGGVYFGFGADTVTAARPLPSEFGLSGQTGYLSISFFF